MIVVGVMELVAVMIELTRSVVAKALGSKFVPAMVSGVPATPMVGVKLATVGAPVAALTVKLVELLAVPAGEVTEIAPSVAPAGTVATICVSVDDATEAVTPLNLTVFWLGVAL